MKSFNYSKLVQHRPNHPEEVDEDLFIVSILWRIKLNICQVKIKKKKILSVEIIFKK